MLCNLTVIADLTKLVETFYYIYIVKRAYDKKFKAMVVNVISSKFKIIHKFAQR